jgi:hypothetical protein
VAFLRRALLVAAFAAAAGCYEPRQPVCAFSCVEDGLCPSGFTCGSDGICHRDNAQGVCEIDPLVDAAQDTAPDAESDGGTPDGDAAD